MKPQPITPYNPTFGIYKGTKITHYGHKDYGIYKENNIEIFHDKKDNMKLQYISDKFRNFIKSKLTYFLGGKKFKTICEGKNGQRYNG